VIKVCVVFSADGAMSRILSAFGLCVFPCVEWASRNWEGNRCEDSGEAVPGTWVSSWYYTWSELVVGEEVCLCEGVPDGRGRGKE
jgi:predicted oxidoreductase